jgi:hypothetical protein
MVGVASETDLMEVIRTAGAVGGLARSLDSGDEEAKQYSDEDQDH